EKGAFPSDRYAIESQIKCRGLDPNECLIEVNPRSGENNIRHEDIESVIGTHNDEIALVMFGGVNYYTGQAFDIARITKAAHAIGA
ncbi:hypothetical protein OFC63_32200, partial [Escherichia coli]|nr:hypothetical protein [Escherichia coli]